MHAGARRGERVGGPPDDRSTPELLEPMPPRRRRTPRRTARRPGSLNYLLAAVLIVGIGYLLIQRGVLPAPPSPTRPSPEADHPGDNSAAIGRLGGAVQYGQVDPTTGQRSGVRATITPAMVAAAAQNELGSAADPGIRPPGLDQLPPRNRARAHLLGRQLGGSGDLPANLVALYQTRANTPVMRDYESAVAEAVQAGETVRYGTVALSRNMLAKPSKVEALLHGRAPRRAEPLDRTHDLSSLSGEVEAVARGDRSMQQCSRDHPKHPTPSAPWPGRCWPSPVPAGPPPRRGRHQPDRLTARG